jgi:hypothetical protein
MFAGELSVPVEMFVVELSLPGEMFVGELSVPGEMFVGELSEFGKCLLESFPYLGKCFVEEFFFQLSLILLASSLLLSVPAHWGGSRDGCRSFCQATADPFQNFCLFTKFGKTKLLGVSMKRKKQVIIRKFVKKLRLNIQ